MKLYSIGNKQKKFTLQEAIFQGMSSDKSLLMPEKIPTLPKSFFNKIEKLNFQQIALKVAFALLKNDISKAELKKIIKQAFNFKVPLIKISENIFTLELFHGPTLAFKDFGGRFMAGLMNFFLKKSKNKLHILAATSGDTGSAVGQAFHNIKNIKVTLLYPKGKISKIQEKQITTIGKNVSALEIDGTFDDCQRLVKEAFTDQNLIQTLRQKNIYLSPANSINIARLIPQTFYYFWAYAQIKKLHSQKAKKTPAKELPPIIFSIPSGNFGNLTAGLIAQKMGLPVAKFIAALNANNSFSEFLKTGNFKAKSSVQTISNAMDVGNPSNFTRILELYENNLEKIRENIWSASFSDKETAAALKELYEKYKYTADPHGAVAYLGVKKYLEKSELSNFTDKNSLSRVSHKASNKPVNIAAFNQNTYFIFLETAHPAKFLDVVEPILNKKISIPKNLQKCLKKEKKTIPMSASYQDFKNYLSHGKL